ncbi:MAG: DUF1566 domain-containing protein [gamma proteobacterium symbiont of Taylorina sp.]|nr:DUF1566 domain-containing protein [gamma proteobacterium symbiont of Taylorina sp.]
MYQSKCDTYHYIEAVNKQGLCGYHDWRMPEIKELESLVVLGSEPTIDNTIFPNTWKNIFWSATTYADDTSQAWFVNFYSGITYFTDKRQAGQVRLVRTIK